jgi:hypothetical protein
MMTISTPLRMLAPQRRSDSGMLEIIVLLLGASTCALLLIAFWGLDLLRVHGRKG